MLRIVPVVDPIVAALCRDEGIAVALNNERTVWKNTFMHALRSLPLGWEGTGEELRLLFLENGLDEPHTHKVWGGMINRCMALGLLSKTGRRKQMETTTSHARETDILIRTEEI